MAWYGDPVYSLYPLSSIYYENTEPTCHKKPYLVIQSRPSKFLTLSFTIHNMANAVNHLSCSGTKYDVEKRRCGWSFGVSGFSPFTIRSPGKRISQPSRVIFINVILKSDGIVEASGSLADSWNSVLRPKLFVLGQNYTTAILSCKVEKMVQYFVA